jgi:hypothetical protein
VHFKISKMKTNTVFQEPEDIISELQARVRSVRRKMTAEKHKLDVFMEEYNKSIGDLNYDLSFYCELLEQYGAVEDDEDTFYSPDNKPPPTPNIHLKKRSSPDYAAATHASTDYVAIGQSLTTENHSTLGSSFEIRSHNDASTTPQRTTATVAATSTPRRSARTQTKKEEIQEERDKARAWFLDRQNSRKKKGF